MCLRREITAPMAGRISDRIGRKKTIVFAAFGLALSTLATYFADSLNSLLFWRFLQGLATPGVFAIAVTYVTEEWPSRSVAFVMSVYVSGTALGGFIGRITAGLAATHLGWRSS